MIISRYPCHVTETYGHAISENCFEQVTGTKVLASSLDIRDTFRDRFTLFLVVMF